MLSLKDVLYTQDMIDKRHLDIRTITMGISLLDCAHEDVNVCAQRIYDKITRRAENLVKVGQDLEWEFGIPIVNKRISVTPMAIVGNSCNTDSYVTLAIAMDKAAKECGVNFIGGFSALVQKGCTKGDWILMDSIPEAMLTTATSRSILACVEYLASFIAFASGISIVLGQLLGAGKLEEAKKAAPKLIAFSVVMCVFVGMVMALVSRVFPDFYNTTEHVKKLATDFIFISACCMPIYSCANATYFVLRSGGKTIVTFLFDSCFVWVVCVPCAYLLVNYTTLGIVMIFFLCQMLEAVKCLIGLALVKKGVWVNTMV